MTDSPEPEQVDLGEVTLSVVDTGGPGRPVLLLHGFPDRAAMWRHQVPALAAAGYRVIAPDLRGFGDSSRPEGPEAYRMPLVRGDLLALLDRLGVERAAVVGHDWGAAAAWTLALTAPDRVERLAVLSVGHPTAMAEAGLPQRSRSWYMLWFLFPGVAEEVLPADDWAFFRQWAHGGTARDADPEVDRQCRDLGRPGALTAALNWYRANIRPEHYVDVGPRRPLPRVGCPVLGVWGDRDLALTERQMTASAEFVDGPWRYERLDGVGHWIATQVPDRLSGLLLDFLGD
jgi:pimeloyl-ACP methyl ester carboxylesterase